MENRNLDKGKEQIFSSRSFNNVVYNSINNSVIKTSKNVDKLINEINWYRLLPDDLQQFHPRIIRYSIERNAPFLEYEFCPYESLSDIFIKGCCSRRKWKLIGNRLMDILLQFKQHTKTFSESLRRQQLYTMLVRKTQERLDLIKTMDPFHHFFYNSFTVNGTKIMPIEQYLNFLEPVFQKLFQPPTPEFCVIHGDFCFSNILYDLTTDSIKIIDPRGDFGGQGSYGDIYYDLAKLRHSINGLYDFIITNHFTLNIERSTVNYRFDTRKKTDVFNLDEFIGKRGYNLTKVKFIEALLFLSMVPLHEEQIDHQIVMFCQGARKFDQVLKELEIDCHTY